MSDKMSRREEREQAFVLIFQRLINHDTTSEIIDAAEMCSDVRVSEFAERLASGVENHESELDERIEKFIRGWKMNRLSRVAMSLLRLSIYEILFEEDIPVNVSINEAIDLAKKYGGADDAPFVNGVLGSVVKELEA